MADITFIVGPGPAPRRVPAHRYVLATGSTVFYAMLYGGLAVSDTDTEEVVVPDVDPDAFLAMLKYLYCDDIQLEPDTVLATLYSAKKYIVPHLARECVRFLETSLTARNACLLLSQARSAAKLCLYSCHILIPTLAQVLRGARADAAVLGRDRRPGRDRAHVRGIHRHRLQHAADHPAQVTVAV